MNKDNNEERNPNGNIVIYPPWTFPGNNFPWPIPPYPEEEEKEKYDGKIKSVSENEFVVVSKDGYLYATGQQSNKFGIFRLIKLKNGKFKLRQKNGKYIRVDERDFLVADVDSKNATKFNIYKIESKEYVLKAPNGYYVRVRDKDKALVARAENSGKKTRFKFKKED